MLDGLYRVSFQTPTGDHSAFCVLKDGHIVGGSEQAYYTGTYKSRGANFSGEIRARRHNNAAVTEDRDEINILLEGIVSGGQGELTGKVRELPDTPPMRASLELVGSRED